MKILTKSGYTVIVACPIDFEECDCAYNEGCKSLDECSRKRTKQTKKDIERFIESKKEAS